jgi:hypothetical protein
MAEIDLFQAAVGATRFMALTATWSPASFVCMAATDREAPGPHGGQIKQARPRTGPMSPHPRSALA